LKSFTFVTLLACVLGLAVAQNYGSTSYQQTPSQQLELQHVNPTEPFQPLQTVEPVNPIEVVVTAEVPRVPDEVVVTQVSEQVELESTHHEELHEEHTELVETTHLEEIHESTVVPEPSEEVTEQVSEVVEENRMTAVTEAVTEVVTDAITDAVTEEELPAPEAVQGSGMSPTKLRAMIKNTRMSNIKPIVTFQ
jgi:hypothetical protein